MVTKLDKKLPVFYETLKSINMLTRSRRWSISQARRIQSTSPHAVSLSSTLILSSHLCVSLPKWSLSFRFTD